MGWLVGGVWIGAGVVGLVVLGFCAYEVSWKARRLRREGERVRRLGERAQQLQVDLAALQQRVPRPD